MALGPAYQMKLSLNAIAMLFAKVKSVIAIESRSVTAKSRSVIALKVGLCPQKSIRDRIKSRSVPAKVDL